MPTFNIEFTDDQYTRFKTAFKKITNMETDPTDEQLTAALKREASAITYAGEDQADKNDPNWQF